MPIINDLIARDPAVFTSMLYTHRTAKEFLLNANFSNDAVEPKSTSHTVCAKIGFGFSETYSYARNEWRNNYLTSAFPRILSSGIITMSKLHSE